MNRSFSLALVLAIGSWPCLAQNAPVALSPAPLGSYAIAGGKAVDHVAMQRLWLAPGARTIRAAHAAPIVGYVAEGTIILQLGNGPAQTLTAGDTAFAPAGTTIDRLENASATEPATFIATFLLGPTEKASIDKVQ